MSPITSSPSLDQLVQYLQSIPPDECKLLERTGEYHRVLRSMQFLKQAHQKLHKKAITATTIQAASLLCAPPTSQLQATAAAPTWTSTVTNAPTITPTTNSTLHRTETAPFDEEQDRLSFLQHEAWDDLLHRILEYTECFDLVNVGATCRRLRTLSLYNSTQRCPYVFRQLQHNTMQLLRCAEQMDGVNSHRGPAVPMPLLLPQRRICITECGDFEYNGIYYCTGSNGNGYVFTKPRSPRRWKEGNLLRCLIAKRFSDTRILWYLSKEVISTETDNDDENSVTQAFSFWSRLMTTADAHDEICQYPSQTSRLSRRGDVGWQNLSTTLAISPPVVELYD